MEKLIKGIKAFFDKTNWKYEYFEDKKMFVTVIDMKDELGKIRVVVHLKESGYITYAILNNTVTSSAMVRVSEYLHRANYGLGLGNFELDYRDGEVRYKLFTLYGDQATDEDNIIESLVVPILMVDRYGKNLLKVMINNDISVEEAINAAEKEEER